MGTTILETSKIAPPQNSIHEFSLPIIFFDMLWYDFPVNQSVLFFEFPCSKSHFFNTIVPHLKRSLSLTLAHFLPLAGKLIHPLPNNHKLLPVVRYQSGDSVSFVVSESDANLNHLTGNHPRVCADFYAFAPNLPVPVKSHDSISCPVLALQVTLFRGRGICLGFATRHAVADASAVVSFIKAWAFINNKNNTIDDLTLKRANYLPFYGRKTVTNLNGLDSIYWDEIVKSGRDPVKPPPADIVPINKVRATFVLTKDEIEKLKNLAVSGDCPVVSSFIVSCALAWVCSSKSGGDDVADDATEYICFAADCRGRLKPPLPANYFGNCVAILCAELKHGEVKGGDGC